MSSLSPFRLSSSPSRDAGADLQHFGRGDAFGIGQVGVDHQRAPQRHREHHPQYAADRGRRRRRPIGKAAPPADDDQARQHEDDRRQRPRRRGDGLDDIVLEDVRAGEHPQHRHRDHRGRDRGREGQPDAQPEIDVGRGEDERDQPAEDDRPERQLPRGALPARRPGRRRSRPARRRRSRDVGAPRGPARRRNKRAGRCRGGPAAAPCCAAPAAPPRSPPPPPRASRARPGRSTG